MDIHVRPTDLDGVRTIDPTVFEDQRGFFYESYSQRTLAANGIDLDFVQDNHSRSTEGVVRGLHYQGPAGAQWRLVRCTVGEILDIAVDLRVDSPTFGQWVGVTLSAANRRQVLIPPPYAHGFVCLSDVAEVQYKCTGFHNPGAERALRWDDPAIGIDWPQTAPRVLSAKDAAAPTWADYLLRPDYPAGWERSTPTLKHEAVPES